MSLLALALVRFLVFVSSLSSPLSTMLGCPTVYYTFRVGLYISRVARCARHLFSAPKLFPSHPKVPWWLKWPTLPWRTYTISRYVMEECICLVHPRQGRERESPGLACSVAWFIIGYLLPCAVLAIYILVLALFWRVCFRLSRRYGPPQKQTLPTRPSWSRHIVEASKLPLPINRPLPSQGGPPWSARDYRQQLQAEAKARGMKANSKKDDLARSLMEDDERRWPYLANTDLWA